MIFKDNSVSEIKIAYIGDARKLFDEMGANTAKYLMMSNL